MEKSIWQKDNNIKDFKQINDNINTDVLIIGAGITGISLAYNLINSTFDVTLIDSIKPLNGVTVKSTGKITYLQDLKYQDIYNSSGYNNAKLYYESQKEAMKIIIKNIKDNGIECNLVKNEGITYTTKEKELKKFEKEEKLLKSFGVKYSNYSNIIDGNDVKKLISIKDSYIFNPTKYLKGLLKNIIKSKNIKIYQNSIAQKIKKENNGYIVLVNGYEVKAKQVVLACHFPFFTIPGLLPLKTYFEKSYITATKVDKVKNVNLITSSYPTYSFRYYDNNNEKYFIYLSNSSKISDKLNYKKNYDSTVNEVKNITCKTPSYKWTNIDVMTNDYLPIIGSVDEDNKNVYIATGYNTWGMTNGVIAAKVIFDLINNKKNKYIDLFSPTRIINLKNLKNFITKTALENTKAYVLNVLKKNPSWYKNKALVTKINDKRVGIYYDEEGNKHIVSNMCPHLKCFLTFNEVDKTWDCPCHSSRFDIDGNVIKGPACYNIKIDESK